MRVLAVEGGSSLAATLSSGMHRHSHVVTLERNGVDGLWALTHGEFDVALVDLILPGMSGYEVIRRARTQNVWVPILAINAHGDEFDEAEAFDLGADDYLNNPFSWVVLLARMRSLQRRGAPSRPVELRLGDLVLEPSRYRVFRAGQEVQLTSREFAVLEYLLRHAGEVVAKTDLLYGVWDEHYSGDVNAVELYVSYLRKKIDIPFGRASIQTVNRRGYRIVDDSTHEAPRGAATVSTASGR